MIIPSQIIIAFVLENSLCKLFGVVFVLEEELKKSILLDFTPLWHYATYTELNPSHRGQGYQGGGGNLPILDSGMWLEYGSTLFSENLFLTLSSIKLLCQRNSADVLLTYKTTVENIVSSYNEYKDQFLRITGGELIKNLMEISGFLNRYICIWVQIEISIWFIDSCTLNKEIAVVGHTKTMWRTRFATESRMQLECMMIS